MSRRVNLADMLDGEPLEEATEAPVKQDIQLQLADIADNPENPRGHIDESDEEFIGLVTSIAEIGVTSPIAVCNAEAFVKSHPQHQATVGGARYVLLAGHRRVHAARKAGRDSVPGIVDDSGAKDPLLWALAENGQRVGLDPIKQAQALYLLTEKPPIGKGLSQGRVAKAIGRTQPYISQLLLLRRLVPALQNLVAAGTLSARDARVFARMPADEQLTAYEHSLTPKAAETRPVGAGSGSTAQQASPVAVQSSHPAPEGGDSGVSELAVAASTHNPVMGTSGSRTAADTPVADREVSPSADGTAQAAPTTLMQGAAQPDVSQAATPGGESAIPSQARGEEMGMPGMPWQDPQALSELISRNMTIKNRAALTMLLIEMNSTR
ncbi:ParB/RepB/Spo0J family partition protein [Streptomyces sp. NPDC032472]|uniref:ParB/RepB/Spo0J family partition protein n=1 Tax=Streptomyces sp. NPDC032472 TaxID=3155018 RepID=UPI00340DEF87